MATINYGFRQNKQELLRTSAFIIALTLITFSAHADGITATGDTLPIGTGNGSVVVETITGSTKEADFSGPVIATSLSASSLGISGTGYVGALGVGTSTPQVPLDVSGYLHVSGNTTPAIPLQGGYLGWNALTGGTGETDFINQQGGGTGGFAFFNAATTTTNNPGTPLVFITGGGRVGVGTTSPQATIDVAGTANVSGALTVASTGYINSPVYYHTSDARLKTDIHPIGNALDKLLSIKGVTFEWKNDGRRDMGVVAQNVAEVFPDVVHKDNKGMMAVEYDSLVGPMIEAIRELKAQNDVLNTKIKSVDELKKENQALKETEIQAVRKNDMLESEIKEIRAEMRQMKQHTTDISAPTAVMPSDVVEH